MPYESFPEANMGWLVKNRFALLNTGFLNSRIGPIIPKDIKQIA